MEKDWKSKACGKHYYNNKKKISDQKKEYYEKYKEKKRKQARKRYRKKRLIVLNHYSNPKFDGIIECNGFDGKKCPWNCSDIDVLTIDHIDDKGAEHRRTLFGQNRGSITNWLISNNFPDGFQVLCRNCQWKKEKVRRKKIEEGNKCKKNIV